MKLFEKDTRDKMKKHADRGIYYLGAHQGFIIIEADFYLGDEHQMEFEGRIEIPAHFEGNAQQFRNALATSLRRPSQNSTPEDVMDTLQLLHDAYQIERTI